VSGESAAGGRPARKRAVSFALAVSALYAGAMPSANALATTAAAIIFSIPVILF
jgi:hypothetical protein